MRFCQKSNQIIEMSKVQVKKIHTLSGHADSVYNLVPKNEQLFFSSSGDGIVALWDLENPENGDLVARVNNSIYAIDYYSEKSLLAVAHNYDGLHLIDVNEKKEIGSLNLTKEAIFEVKFFRNYVFLGLANGDLIAVDYTQLSKVRTLQYSKERLRRLLFNKKNNELVAAYSDNYIRVFDLKNLQLKYEFVAHENSVFSMVFSPDNNYLLSVGRDAKINVWDVKGGYLKMDSISAHMYAINDIAFSPDGKHFVTCSMDKSIKVWDYEQLKLLKVIDKSRHAGHGTSVNKLLWTPYNNLLVSCSDDRSISVWDITFEN